MEIRFIGSLNAFSCVGASTSEAQVRVAVEVAEQFIALTGRSKEYKEYLGVVNQSVLKKWF